MATEMYRISREFVWWRIITSDDLTESTAEVACLPNPADIPEESDWVAAEIVSPDDPDFGDGNDWWVKALIGPSGDLDLSTGDSYPIDYQSWIRITDNPERPVRKPGVLTIL